MYKFKASKYKNAMPKVPKKEGWILDISVGSPQSHGNHIKASGAYMVFNSDTRGGGSLGVLSLDASGRIRKDAPMLHCHSEKVTDFDFSCFDDGLLATGSQDCTVKLWRLPEGDLNENLSNPVLVLPVHNRRVENVVFHPAADQVLSTSSGTSATVWDISTNQSLWDYSSHGYQVLNMSWKGDGSLLATIARDKLIRVLDPRTNGCVQETSGHQNPKDARIVWLGESNRILTSGFDSSHQRQVCLRDVRNFVQPLKLISPDTATGILIPLFDCDTNMLFLAGKADSSVIFLEVTDNEPYLTEASRHTCEQPIKGACLVPKRALNVMQCEVNRLLQLTVNAIVPVAYQVPRKTFRDFHSDLFPETNGLVPAMNAQEWFQGANDRVPKVTLNPSSRNGQSLLRFKHFPEHNLEESVLDDDAKSVSVHAPEKKQSINGHLNGENMLKTSYNSNIPCNGPGPVPAPRRRLNSNSDFGDGVLSRSMSVDSTSSEGHIVPPVPVAAPRSNLRKNSIGEASVVVDVKSKVQRCQSMNSHSGILFGAPGSPSLNRGKTDTNASNGTNNSTKAGGKISKALPGFRPSKFRHLHGAPLHRSTHIENLRNLSTSITGECDGFHVNHERVAVPLRGPGGKIAVFELKKPGRLPDGVVPVVLNGAMVMDFAWDPFDTRRLAVACDDAKIRIWIIPESGLTETITVPDEIVSGHVEKIYLIKFHPLAKEVLASGSYDLTVRIWDLSTGEEKKQLDGHTDQIFSLAWSPDGRKLATVCKDNKLRIYEPRKSTLPIAEGTGPVGNRGARVIWALEGKFLVVTGFDRVSERQIIVYNIESLNSALTTVGIDVSPAILIPFYDEDSSTLFLTGKGDSTIYAYEVCSESPYLFPLSHHKCPNSHQALAYLPKFVCQVKDVEFLRSLRLTPTVIEPLSFTVPRVKMGLFQNDLFPDTRVLWEPTLSSTEWFSGKDCAPRLMCLQPDGMKPLIDDSTKALSKVTPLPSDVKTSQSSFARRRKADLNTLFATMAIGDGDLPQDGMEGVEAKEWDD